MHKSKFYLTTLAAFSIAVVCLVNGCSKNIKDRSWAFPALNPAKTDSLAGTWKPILLTAPTEFPVAAPLPTSNASYIRELNEVKSYQANITADQKRNVEYWSAGAVLRWNEIMRTLVARHNLAPYQNPDGTYPAPSAANPFAYPQFPFSNPPYAARAYAYVSAAQYDALVAAWHYKKLYNRKAPYAVDNAITPLIPQSTMPSYPSEDAVVEGVTVELLKLLFPTEIAFIQQQADAHKTSRLISGANVRSDIEAGELLGKQVAQKFITRATTDRAGAAIGNQTLWTQLEQDCIARGEIPWMSLDAPKRPPMLPLFGKVKPFLFDSLTVISLRPVPPPSTGSAQMRAETDEVLWFSKNATREQMGIVHFWADGTGTYAPPGHWNAIAAEDFVQRNFSEVRWARNLALVNMSLMDAAIVCWDTKNFYFNPRPSQLNPAIKTLTGIPNFPAYISGHSTFSAAAATTLGYIIPDRAAAYEAMAKEASMSRLYGAIHYRSDCEVGLQVGSKVGNYAVIRGRADGADQ
ncbi:MAG: phosphatase PAP2 family protein [Ferruginibacter sp.]